MKLLWMDDLKLESDLRAMGIAFEVTTIKLSVIDFVASADNGARIGDPVMPGLVADYKLAMLNGDIFPRPAVRKIKSGYLILSGNQRCAAVRELVADGDLPPDCQIEAYLLATDDPMLVNAVIRSANVGHGGRTTWDERVAHAIFMVSSLGMAIADASKLFIVSKTTITARIRAEEVRKELGKACIATSTIATATLDVLGQIQHDERSFRQMGSLVAQHAPPTERVRQMVGSVKKAKSDTDRLRIVKNFENELTQEAHAIGAKRDGTLAKLPQRPRRDRLIGDLKRVVNWLENGTDGEPFGGLRELQITAASDEKLLRDLWSRLEMRMRVILKKK